ncbi:MAG: hypothetical protein HUJ13_09125 [Hydrogenovibrio crunogenus]|nr:hypothetical protein [Hydrogenovibrio crunogenus]
MKRKIAAKHFDEIELLSRCYKSHGGKKNRRQQVKKVRRVFKFANNKYQTPSVYSIGKKQIISFYHENCHLSDQTLYAYWLALKQLYKWMNRSGEPPKPRTKQFMPHSDKSEEER